MQGAEVKKLLIAAGSCAAIAALIAVLPSPAASRAPNANVDVSGHTPAASSATGAAATTTAVVAVSGSVAAPAYDRFAHREDIEAAVARKDVSALAELQKIELAKDGYVAAAAIAGVGKLAALAPEAEKREAIKTLDRWLKQETARRAPESVGNVSIVVDALEATKSEQAIGPLVSALDAANQPLHIETRIVEALIALHARTAIASVERFAKRVSTLQPHDDFEKSLALEATAAANTALSEWRAP